MAKVDPFPVAPGAEPRVRGVFLVQPGNRGWIARKWPRKRGAPTTPYDAYKQAEFGYAAQWASSPEAVQLKSATYLVEGSSFVPRDLLVRAIYGTAVEIQLEDGTVLQSGRQVTTNPQYILDLISDTVGALLWRSPDGWDIIPPGLPGQVLTNVANIPQWAGEPSPPEPAFAWIENKAGGFSGATTFSACNFGAAATDRLIVLAIGWARQSTATREIDSVTIGGIAATRVVEYAAGAFSFLAEIWQANVPAGTTGDVVLTFSGTGGTTPGVSFSIFRMTGYWPTPVDSGNFNDGGDPTVDLTGEACIAVACHDVDNSNPDFTGLTVTLSASSPGTWGTVQTAGGVEGPTTISQPAESGNVRGVAASWNPS